MRLGLICLILTLASLSFLTASPLAHGGQIPVSQNAGTTISKSDAVDLLRRLTREAVRQGGKGKPGGCKYRKGQWSACDPQTKVRTRTFTLKKGDVNICETSKTLQKECRGPGGKKGGKQRGNQKNRNSASKNQNQDKAGSSS